MRNEKKTEKRKIATLKCARQILLDDIEELEFDFKITFIKIFLALP